MNILHVMPSVAASFGGPTRSLVGYARAAKTAGMFVSVAAPECTEQDRQRLRSELGGASLHLFPSFSRGAMILSPRLIAWVNQNAVRYDVVHVHGLLNLVSSMAARACLSRRLPVVVRPFGTLSRYTFAHRRAWFKNQYFKWLDGPNLEQASGVHFTTEAERDEAAWHRIDFSRASHVVPPPWDRVVSGGSASVSARPTVLFLSRLDPKKNLESVLTAWPYVRMRVPDARLVIAGDGPSDYVNRLKTRAAGMRDASSIHFAGFVDGEEKARILASASVFVLPSHQENFGVAVLEALGAGVPVVISPEVQLASFVTRHGLGRVAQRDPEAIARALIDVLKDAPFRQYCRDRAPAHVERHFSLEAVGQRLSVMYQTVLQRASHR